MRRRIGKRVVVALGAVALIGGVGGVALPAAFADEAVPAEENPILTADNEVIMEKPGSLLDSIPTEIRDSAGEESAPPEEATEPKSESTKESISVASQDSVEKEPAAPQQIGAEDAESRVGAQKVAAAATKAEFIGLELEINSAQSLYESSWSLTAGDPQEKTVIPGEEDKARALMTLLAVEEPVVLPLEVKVSDPVVTNSWSLSGEGPAEPVVAECGSDTVEVPFTLTATQERSATINGTVTKPKGLKAGTATLSEVPAMNCVFSNGKDSVDFSDDTGEQAFTCTVTDPAMIADTKFTAEELQLTLTYSADGKEIADPVVVDLSKMKEKHPTWWNKVQMRDEYNKRWTMTDKGTYSPKWFKIERPINSTSTTFKFEKDFKNGHSEITLGYKVVVPASCLPVNSIGTPTFEWYPSQAPSEKFCDGTTPKVKVNTRANWTRPLETTLQGQISGEGKTSGVVRLHPPSDVTCSFDEPMDIDAPTVARLETGETASYTCTTLDGVKEKNDAETQLSVAADFWPVPKSSTWDESAPSIAMQVAVIDKLSNSQATTWEVPGVAKTISRTKNFNYEKDPSHNFTAPDTGSHWVNLERVYELGEAEVTEEYLICRAPGQCQPLEVTIPAQGGFTCPAEPEDEPTPPVDEETEEPEVPADEQPGDSGTDNNEEPGDDSGDDLIADPPPVAGDTTIPAVSTVLPPSMVDMDDPQLDWLPPVAGVNEVPATAQPLVADTNPNQLVPGLAFTGSSATILGSLSLALMFLGSLVVFRWQRPVSGRHSSRG